MNDLSTSTAGTLSAVDLSKLPFPAFIADQDYETILAQMIEDTNVFHNAKTGQPYIAHEADPAYIIIEACAYRRWMDLKDYQNQLRQNLVAYATGAMLDNLGANPDFKCARLVVVPANDTATPPTPAVMESDDDYRARLVLSNEGYTTAGSAGAYLFHTKTADGDVRDASIQSPEPGQVLVTVLTYSNKGTPTAPLLDKIKATLSADTVRPLCDEVIARPASVHEYSADVRITTYPATDIPDTVARAKAAIEAYAEAHFRLGHDITRSGIIAAATVAGVQNVAVLSPQTDLVTDLFSARLCAGVTVIQSETAL